MNKNDSKKYLDYFGAALIAYGYITDYTVGFTANTRPKIEFTYEGDDFIVVHIPTKGFQCYMNNQNIGIFKNHADFIAKLK